MLSIGLMSGTSMDGIDAALIKTDGKSQVTMLDNVSCQYDAEFVVLLKSVELAVRIQQGHLQQANINFSDAVKLYCKNNLALSDQACIEKIKILSRYFHQDENKKIRFDEVIQRSTQLHANLVMQLLAKSGYAASQIDIIGYHGQTVFHQPARKITLQLGDGHSLAKQTGIRVINDFRQQDVAHGGQGAPLAPLYHQALAVRDDLIPVAIINCGGIANVTIITGTHEDDVLGFDTGPANGLIDRFVKLRTQGQEQMDMGGQYGKQGKVHTDILNLLYEKSINSQQANYFTQLPPKSLDIGELYLIPELESLTLADGCATLEAFTADSIVESTRFFANKIPQRWILAGGGWQNPVIRQELETRLTKKLGDQVQINTADEIGWLSQALEAQLFAYLAVRSLLKLPISLPKTTRAPYPLTGGILHLPM